MRRSGDDKRAEEETMGSFSDSKQFFIHTPPPPPKKKEKVRENANKVGFYHMIFFFWVAHKLCLFCSWMFEQTLCRIQVFNLEIKYIVSLAH